MRTEAAVLAGKIPPGPFQDPSCFPFLPSPSHTVAFFPAQRQAGERSICFPSAQPSARGVQRTPGHGGWRLLLYLRGAGAPFAA